SSRRRHTRLQGDWSSDVCSSDLTSYQTSLAIAERLAKVDPGGGRWRRELSATYNKVGDMLLEQHNLPDALKSYRAGIAIAERLRSEERRVGKEVRAGWWGWHRRK